jgi:predicted RNA binding protein YcfA (HicA-like mRNA interferase family)
VPKLPPISGRECVKALEKLGFAQIRQRGSHVVMRRAERGCVVPMHRTLKTGTLRGILKPMWILMISSRPCAADATAITPSAVRGSPDPAPAPTEGLPSAVQRRTPNPKPSTFNPSPTTIVE